MNIIKNTHLIAFLGASMLGTVSSWAALLVDSKQCIEMLKIAADKKEAKELSENPALILKQECLDMRSKQNTAIGNVFLSHPVLRLKDVRDIIFDYHGPEWYKKEILEIPDVTFSTPVETLCFVGDDSHTLRATQIVDPHDTDASNLGVIEWDVVSGSLANNAIFSPPEGGHVNWAEDQWRHVNIDDPVYILPTACNLDNSIKAFYIVPGMQCYCQKVKDFLFGRRNFGVILAYNKIALLNHIISARLKDSLTACAIQGSK